MNPGSEMDALVAEKVMQCQVERREPPQYGYVYFHCGCQGNLHGAPEPHDDCLASYSIDNAAAVQVLGKLSRDYIVNIQNCHAPEIPWCVMAIGKEEDGGIDGYGQGEFAYAVCQAALETVGVKKYDRKTIG